MKEEINEYPYLANYFKENPEQIEDFIEYVEIGRQMGRWQILHHLIDIYNDWYNTKHWRFACIPYTMICAVYNTAYDEKDEKITAFEEDISFEEAMNRFNPAAKNNFDDELEVTAIFDAVAQIDFPMVTMKVLKYYLNNREKRAALCFGLWENIGCDDGFLMRRVSESESNLPVDIWLDDSGVWAAKECWNRPIIKFEPYKNRKHKQCLIPMSVDDNPEILFRNPKMELTEEEVNQIKKYVIKEKKMILKMTYHKDNLNFDPRSLVSISISDDPQILDEDFLNKKQ